PHCPRCGRAVAAVAPERVIEALLARPEGTRVVLLAPRGKGEAALDAARKDGFVRVRIGAHSAPSPDPAAPAGTPAAAEALLEVAPGRRKTKRALSTPPATAQSAGPARGG